VLLILFAERRGRDAGQRGKLNAFAAIELSRNSYHSTGVLLFYAPRPDRGNQGRGTGDLDLGYPSERYERAGRPHEQTSTATIAGRIVLSRDNLRPVHGLPGGVHAEIC